MPQTYETRPLGAAGLGIPSNCSDAFDPPDNAPKSPRVQEAIAGLKREFIVECLRLAALKASHGADNLEIGDDHNAERDIRIAIENAREAGRAFRELQLLLKGESQS
jgi:hypothetical protein